MAAYSRFPRRIRGLTVDKASTYAKGAGFLWRPLHFSAEALTEPAGETVATRSVDERV